MRDVVVKLTGQQAQRLRMLLIPQPAVVSDPQLTYAPPVNIQHTGPLSTRLDVMQPTVGIVGDPAACPQCGGKGLVKSTQGKIQYRQCKTCGERYKTEKIAS